MRIVRTAIFAGIASAALAGAAMAAHDPGKTMLVAFPDGSVEHIRYEGDVAPRLVLVAAPSPASFFDVAFGPSSPFAQLERISAEMEAQAGLMMRQAAMAQARAVPDGEALVLTKGQQPTGVMRYSYVSSVTSADGCTRTVRINSSGGDRNPEVIRTSAGDCSTAPTAPAPAIAPKPRSVRPVTPVSLPAPLPAFTPSPVI